MQQFDCPHCHRIFENTPGEDEVVLCPHCNSAVALPEKDLPPGTMVGGFEIIRLLGHGGMGNVYLANQISMNRPVALKILLKSMTQDKDSVDQFLNEAKVSGKLNHRNIITAIDAGEIDGTYFLVTTFVDGLDLEKKIEQEKIISEKDTLRIGIKIGDALKYAWERYGMLHKDIKPANIMIDSNNEAYLMDMGIAQFIGEHHVEDEHILGSPFFMSPEQTRAQRLSWTTDLYSLGATMYNMVAGVPPYDADDVMEIIEMHSKSPFPLPSERNPEAKVSKQTVILLKKMMAKDPNDRFDSWGGFEEAANAALKALDAPKKATGSSKKKTRKGTKSTTMGRPVKKAKRRRRAAASGGAGGGMILLIVLLFAGIIVAAGYFFYTKNRLDRAKAALGQAETFLMRNNGNCLASIEVFRKAAQFAKGTPLEERAEERLAEIENEGYHQAQLIKEYRQSKDKAQEMVREKRYDDAIAIIAESIKDIKDASIKKEAEMFIDILKKQKQKKR